MSNALAKLCGVVGKSISLLQCQFSVYKSRGSHSSTPDQILITHSKVYCTMDDNRKPPRLVAQMTFEQAEMKRASDRVHQRYSRARRQNRIAELERKNAMLTSQLQEMEKQLQEMRKSQECLHPTAATSCIAAPHFNQSPLAQTTTGLIENNEGKARGDGRPLLPHNSSSTSTISSHTSAFMAPPLIGCLTQNLNSSMSYFLDFPLDFSTNPEIEPPENISESRTISFTTFPEENYMESLPWLICDQSAQSSSPFPPPDRAHEGRHPREIELQPSFTLAPRISEWSQAEQLISVHLPPSTPTDHVLIEVSEFGRRWSQQKGQQYEELHLPNYPDLSSLLKPTSRDSTFPVSSAISKHASWATSVHSLASRVAYHYMVAQMVRWMVCRTEQSYNQLPPFLRPTELQRIVPHPAWVDIFFW
jgi:hypothetical protein